MDNNYDNKPKEGDVSQQPSAGPDVSGQSMDADTGSQSVSVSDSGNQYTDSNAGQQPADSPDPQMQYTDPNAGRQPDYQQYPYANQNNAYNYNQQNNGYQYQNQNNGYNYGQQNQNGSYNYSQNNGYNYQDNYNYNTGNNNQMYEPGQDCSPMSMGDWLLTMLAAAIPCVGIVLYFVWAFSKTTNVNRRNFCRAQLIMLGVVLAIYIIFIALFGTMLFRGSLYY